MEVSRPRPAAQDLTRRLVKETRSALGRQAHAPRQGHVPGHGITKATLAAYYAAVAERMLPHIRIGRCRWSATLTAICNKHVLPKAQAARNAESYPRRRA